MKEVLFKLLEDADKLLASQNRVNNMLLAAIDELKKQNT